LKLLTVGNLTALLFSLFVLNSTYFGYVARSEKLPNEAYNKACINFFGAKLARKLKVVHGESIPVKHTHHQYIHLPRSMDEKNALKRGFGSTMNRD